MYSQFKNWLNSIEFNNLNLDRLPCQHKGTYADDCLVNRVSQHKVISDKSIYNLSIVKILVLYCRNLWSWFEKKDKKVSWCPNNVYRRQKICCWENARCIWKSETPRKYVNILMIKNKAKITNKISSLICKFNKVAFLNLSKVVFWGATDLTESQQTNRMRCHRTFFAFNWKLEKLRPKFFFNFRKFFHFFFKIRDFQMTQYRYEMKLEEILRLMTEK